MPVMPGSEKAVTLRLAVEGHSVARDAIKGLQNAIKQVADQAAASKATYEGVSEEWRKLIATGGDLQTQVEELSESMAPREIFAAINRFNKEYEGDLKQIAKDTKEAAEVTAELGEAYEEVAEATHEAADELSKATDETKEAAEATDHFKTVLTALVAYISVRAIQGYIDLGESTFQLRQQFEFATAMTDQFGVGMREMVEIVQEASGHALTMRESVELLSGGLGSLGGDAGTIEAVVTAGERLSVVMGTDVATAIQRTTSAILELRTTEFRRFIPELRTIPEITAAIARELGIANEQVTQAHIRTQLLIDVLEGVKDMADPEDNPFTQLKVAAKDLADVLSVAIFAPGGEFTTWTQVATGELTELKGWVNENEGAFREWVEWIGKAVILLAGSRGLIWAITTVTTLFRSFARLLILTVIPAVRSAGIALGAAGLGGSLIALAGTILVAATAWDIYREAQRRAAQVAAVEGLREIGMAEGATPQEMGLVWDPEALSGFGSWVDPATGFVGVGAGGGVDAGASLQAEIDRLNEAMRNLGVGAGGGGGGGGGRETDAGAARRVAAAAAEAELLALQEIKTQADIAAAKAEEELLRIREEHLQVLAALTKQEEWRLAQLELAKEKADELAAKAEEELEAERARIQLLKENAAKIEEAQRAALLASGKIWTDLKDLMVDQIGILTESIIEGDIANALSKTFDMLGSIIAEHIQTRIARQVPGLGGSLLGALGGGIVGGLVGWGLNEIFGGGAKSQGSTKQLPLYAFITNWKDQFPPPLPFSFNVSGRSGMFDVGGGGWSLDQTRQGRRLAFHLSR